EERRGAGDVGQGRGGGDLPKGAGIDAQVQVAQPEGQVSVREIHGLFAHRDTSLDAEGPRSEGTSSTRPTRPSLNRAAAARAGKSSMSPGGGRRITWRRPRISSAKRKAPRPRKETWMPTGWRFGSSGSPKVLERSMRSVPSSGVSSWSRLKLPTWVRGR